MRGALFPFLCNNYECGKPETKYRSLRAVTALRYSLLITQHPAFKFEKDQEEGWQKYRRKALIFTYTFKISTTKEAHVTRNDDAAHLAALCICFRRKDALAKIMISFRNNYGTRPKRGTPEYCLLFFLFSYVINWLVMLNLKHSRDQYFYVCRYCSATMGVANVSGFLAF